MSKESSHLIAVLALERVVAFDLAIPCQVFGHGAEADRYRVELCAAAPGTVQTTTGFAIVVPTGLELVAAADTVIVPGFDGPVPPTAAAALAAAGKRGARLVSICTGAFALAAGGVLDGRRATTHWRDADELAAQYPRVQVDPDVLFVDEGSILTSAGVAAGIDLCLHIVQRDHGSAVANAIARRMVVAPQRDGGQAQFVERPAGDPVAGLARTRAWMTRHIDRRLTVRALARHARCSERTFARSFVAETGLPPLRWLHAQRIAEARRLLETTDLQVETIARQCGFGSATSLREQFRRALQTTPTAYRARWSQ